VLKRLGLTGVSQPDGQSLGVTERDT